MREKVRALGGFVQECDRALTSKTRLEEMLSMMSRGFITELLVHNQYVALDSVESRAAAVDILEQLLDEATARVNRLEKELDNAKS